MMGVKGRRNNFQGDLSSRRRRNRTGLYVHQLILWILECNLPLSLCDDFRVYAIHGDTQEFLVYVLSRLPGYNSQDDESRLEHLHKTEGEAQKKRIS